PSLSSIALAKGSVRVICLFLVVYQKKYHFCLHVFQNISIFATLFSSVTYKVTALIIKLLLE
ncbi:hypothetical protein, partial [Serratia marcescens]|uniref:hypothetical protein n=1 Tax=Serratia marcescens TaxID=615 RepID=UPI003C6F20A6